MDSDSSLLPREDTERRQPQRTRKGLSADTESAHVMILDFPASGTARIKFLLSVRQPTFAILLSQPEWTKTALAI